jgi:hypothetical protein
LGARQHALVNDKFAGSLGYSRIDKLKGLLHAGSFCFECSLLILKVTCKRHRGGRSETGAQHQSDGRADHPAAVSDPLCSRKSNH